MRDEPAYRDLELVGWGEDRQQTAIVLLGTALELGYSKHVIKVSKHGFLAPQDVVDEVGDSHKKKAPASRGRKTKPMKVDFDADKSEKE